MLEPLIVRKPRVRGCCSVCGQRAEMLTSFREIALLCPLHHEVVRGIIPPPMTEEAIRSLFPARVTARGRR